MARNIPNNYALFKLVQEYCYLAKQPTLSEEESERMQTILELAYYDDELNLLISDAEDLIDYDLTTSNTTNSALFANENSLPSRQFTREQHLLNGQNKSSDSGLSRFSVTTLVKEEQEINLGNAVLCETTLAIQSTTNFFLPRNSYSIGWVETLLHSRIVSTIAQFLSSALPAHHKQASHSEFYDFTKATEEQWILIRRADLDKQRIYTTCLRNITLLFMIFLNSFVFLTWQAKHWTTIPGVRQTSVQQFVPALLFFLAIRPSS